jgi:hypothetical protein
LYPGQIAKARVGRRIMEVRKRILLISVSEKKKTWVDDWKNVGVDWCRWTN